jgi:hypothetical protein
MDKHRVYFLLLICWYFQILDTKYHCTKIILCAYNIWENPLFDYWLRKQKTVIIWIIFTTMKLESHYCIAEGLQVQYWTFFHRCSFYEPLEFSSFWQVCYDRPCVCPYKKNPTSPFLVLKIFRNYETD